MSGFVRCADCQKAMRRKTARGITYYACRSYTDKRICSKRSIRQDKLESAVLAALQMQIALVDQLAEEILTNAYKPGDTILLKLQDDKIVFERKEGSKPEAEEVPQEG